MASTALPPVTEAELFLCTENLRTGLQKTREGMRGLAAHIGDCDGTPEAVAKIVTAHG